MRLAFIDNIRSVMIVLVLSMHAADTYSPFGNWYYTEHRAADFPTVAFFGFYQSFLQAFFMALLFLIAGYFTPGSFAKKGPARFLWDRFVRLGLPTLLYMLLIGPLTEYYLSRTWRTPKSFAGAWWEHIIDGEVFGMTGPMWFCAALFIFCCFYAAAASLARKERSKSRRTIVINNKNVMLLAASVALSTFLVKGMFPCGAAFYNMHLSDFPSYIILFTSGIWAYRRGWIGRLPYEFGLRWGAVALGIGCVLWPALIMLGGGRHGNMAAFECGWHWQDLGLSIWAAIICVGSSLGLIVFFREKLNAQGSLARFMSANAFAVYVFHPPILIALALALSQFSAPAITKFLLLSALGVVASFLAAEYVFRRIPLLNRII
jgi:fucose 4-O-acetylase-like acetyltransferase